MSLLGAFVACGAGKLVQHGIVIDERSPESQFHHRIRVMWLGESLKHPQAQAFSVSGNKITTWVSPKSFVVLEVLDGF